MVDPKSLSSSLLKTPGSVGPPTQSSSHPPTHQASKHGKKATPLSHQQFWLNISSTAAQHNCHISHSRRHRWGMQCQAEAGETSTSGSSDDDSLLVVGPGVLGGLVGKLWREAHSSGPGCTVVGQTNTDTNHARLKRLGLVPRLKQDADEKRFPNVLFSAPPSGSKDYVAEVKGALQQWDGRGTFIFTSSSAVFKVDEGGSVTEDAPLHQLGTSERLDKLLGSEQAVLEAGGCVVRLVGLYHANRGAHTFFLRQGEVPRWGGHVVNLVHYEDAASLCLKVLEHNGRQEPFKGQTFLGTDASPLTFQEMMDATIESGAFEGSCNFTGPPEESAAPGSSNDTTRATLDWAPKFSSFQAFMQKGAKDVYQEL